MTLEDLEYIFTPQLEAGDTDVFFMLLDGEHKEIIKHLANDLEGLLPTLSSFTYFSNEARIPRFKK